MPCITDSEMSAHNTTVRLPGWMKTTEPGEAVHGPITQRVKSVLSSGELRRRRTGGDGTSTRAASVTITMGLTLRPSNGLQAYVANSVLHLRDECDPSTQQWAARVPMLLTQTVIDRYNGLLTRQRAAGVTRKPDPQLVTTIVTP